MKKNETFGAFLASIGLFIIILNVELGGFKWAIALLCLGIGGMLVFSKKRDKVNTEPKNKNNKK